MNPVYEFIDAIHEQLGFAPDASQFDTAADFVRFSAPDKKNGSCYARLFDDQRGGVFGDFRSGISFTWQAKGVSALTAIDRELRAREIEQCREERAVAEQLKHSEASDRTSRLCTAATRVEYHRYLERKHAAVAGLLTIDGAAAECDGQFYVTGQNERKERLRGDLVIVPMRDVKGKVWSAQAIDEEGRKSFLRGGRTRGVFFLIGGDLLTAAVTDGDEISIAIAEGLATGAAVHKLSGMPTFVAFSSGNLLPVAQAVRQALPIAHITIAGDVDRSGTGQRMADAAASAVGGDVALPEFTAAQIEAGCTDWCDWVIAQVASTSGVAG